MIKTYELKPKKVKAYKVESLEKRPKWSKKCGWGGLRYGVDTLEGIRPILIGEWIISLGKGYYEVLSEDEFKRKYRQVK